MTDHHDDPLKMLESEAVPPPLLKARVRESLRSRGLLRRGPRSAWRAAFAAAAAVVVFVAGMVAGRRADGPVPHGAGAYLLLLYQDADFHPSRSEDELVAEYGAWAGRLGAEGKLVSGEKLDSAARLLEAPGGTTVVSAVDVGSSAGAVAGFFIVRAASYDEAVEIARTCPHLRHGGRIAVRAIVPT